MASPAGNPGGNGPWNPWQFFNFCQQTLKSIRPQLDRALDRAIAEARAELSDHDNEIVNRALQQDERRQQAVQRLQNRLNTQTLTSAERQTLDASLADPSIPQDDVGAPPVGRPRIVLAPNIMPPSEETLREAALIIQTFLIHHYRNQR